MATTPIDQPAEPRTGTGEHVTAPVLNVLRGMWYMSLGLAAVTGEQTGRLVKALVDKGKEIEPSVVQQGKRAGEGMAEVGGKLKELATKVGAASGRAEAALDEKVAAALRRMGFPEKEEIAALSAKLDNLSERLEELAAKKQARKPAE